MRDQGGHHALNQGWGRDLAYAGKQILQARFGGGHFASVASHVERWRCFATWAKAEAGVRDLRQVTPELVSCYAGVIKGQGRAERCRRSRIDSAPSM